jgi:hypothetical protein
LLDVLKALLVGRELLMGFSDVHDFLTILRRSTAATTITSSKNSFPISMGKS